MEKENTGSLMKYSMNNPVGDEKEGGSHKSPKANTSTVILSPDTMAMAMAIMSVVTVT